MVVSKCNSSFVEERILSHTALFLREDGILEIILSNYLTYDVNHLSDILVAIKELSKGKKIPLLHIAGDQTSVTPEAREYMSAPESLMYSLAEAYVIHTLAQRILANFYLKISKPKVPTRFFNDEKKAAEWLLSIKNETTR